MALEAEPCLWPCLCSLMSHGDSCLTFWICSGAMSCWAPAVKAVTGDEEELDEILGVGLFFLKDVGLQIDNLALKSNSVTLHFV